MMGLEIRELIKYLLQAATPGIEATDYTFRRKAIWTHRNIWMRFSRELVYQGSGLLGRWSTSIESLKWEGALGPLITNTILDAFDESVFDGRPLQETHLLLTIYSSSGANYGTKERSPIG